MFRFRRFFSCVLLPVVVRWCCADVARSYKFFKAFSFCCFVFVFLLSHAFLFGTNSIAQLDKIHKHEESQGTVVCSALNWRNFLVFIVCTKALLCGSMPERSVSHCIPSAIWPLHPFHFTFARTESLPFDFHGTLFVVGEGERDDNSSVVSIVKCKAIFFPRFYVCK